MTSITAGAFMCIATLNGQVCYRADYPSHDQSRSERAIIVTCAFPQQTADILWAPLCPK